MVKALGDADADEGDVECAPHLLDVILQHCGRACGRLHTAYIALLHDRHAALWLHVSA